MIVELIFLLVMFYNILGWSIVNIFVEIVVCLLEIINVVLIKEVSGNLDVMVEIISKIFSDFILYSGDDGLIILVLVIGGVGVILVVFYIIGNDM